MPLHLHHAHRAELLVEALADVLAEAPDDPFATEVVAVPSRGIERWIAQRLSHHLGAQTSRGDGVAANITFPFPGAIVNDALARATGVQPDDDRWRPDRLMWPLLDVVTDAVTAGEANKLGPLAVHVTPKPDDQHGINNHRLAAVRSVAELFDRYAVHRPAMLRAWAAGEDLGPTNEPLRETALWQPHVWRQLHQRIGTGSAAERLVDATAAIAAGHDIHGEPLDLELPDRINVFGLTALSPTTVEVLGALAQSVGASGQTRDVHLYVRHPSPVAWHRTAHDLDSWRAKIDGNAGGGADGPRAVAATSQLLLPTREHDPTVETANNPLVADWGRDARELHTVVHAINTIDHDRSGTDPANPPSLPANANLLQRLQHDIITDTDAAATAVEKRPVLDADDRTVQLHRCHGPARQVDVLRDVVLHVLNEEPDLQPRDIIVQCPDIETYAPLIEAVFSSSAVTVDRPSSTDDAGDNAEVADPSASLRVQLADRALTRTNPLLRVLAELLELANGRVTGSAVLDLCARGPVRRRFELDEEDLERLENWLETTGIRWGLDKHHRETREVPTDANTWERGLDRLLVGVAVADESQRTVHGIVPEDEVEGNGVELAGRFAELITRIRDVIDTFATPRPVGTWVNVLRESLQQVAIADPEASWQLAGVDRILEELRDAVTGSGPGTGAQRINSHEIRDLLGDRLAGAPSRAAHRTGDLTVSTLVPMRSVPHAVVIWLGMDDEVFPRKTVADGDDLLAIDPLVGDRDPRTEDRQLLLDSLLAAGRRLIVLTTGHDERTGEQRPPAVPIGELCDVIDRTVQTGLTDPDGKPIAASAAIAVDHPLQPADIRRFTPAGVGVAGHAAVANGKPFGFDRNELAATRAAAGERHPPPAFLQEPLPPYDDEGRIDLGELVAFLQHPIHGLLWQRFGTRFSKDGDVSSDTIPIEMGGLAKWAIGDQLLVDFAAGFDRERSVATMRARGQLPPDDLADDPLEEVFAIIDALIEFGREHAVPLEQDTEAVPIDATLPDGRQLVGSVEVVGNCRRHLAYTKLGYNHRLAAWIELLALIVTDPTRPWRAVSLGRGRENAAGKPLASMAQITPRAEVPIRHGKKKPKFVPSSLGEAADPDTLRNTAMQLLMDLIDLRDRGLRYPLLLPCKTAGTYAELTFKAQLGLSSANPITNAQKEWVTAPNSYPHEDADPAHLQVLGPRRFDELLAIAPEPDEDGPGWYPEESSRLVRLARRVWEPLLHAEEVVDV